MLVPSSCLCHFIHTFFFSYAIPLAVCPVNLLEGETLSKTFCLVLDKMGKVYNMYQALHVGSVYIRELSPSGNIL